MNPLLECCEQNLAKGLDQVVNLPEIASRVDLVTYGCMNECQTCAKMYYGFLEGEWVTGNTLDEFKTHLLEALDYWEKENL